MVQNYKNKWLKTLKNSKKGKKMTIFCLFSLKIISSSLRQKWQKTLHLKGFFVRMVAKIQEKINEQNEIKMQISLLRKEIDNIIEKVITN